MPEALVLAEAFGAEAFGFDALTMGGFTAGGGLFSSFSIGSIATSLASNLVLGGLSKALQSAPESGNFSGTSAFSAQGITITVQQAIGPQQIIIGRRRVGGQLTYKEVTSDNANYHLIITFAGHVCEEIETILFGDEEIPLDDDGNATGRFAGFVRIKKSLGDEAGQPFADLVAESAGKWTDAHRQTGHTKIYARLTASRDLFPGGIPNITAVIRGHKWYDPRTATTIWSANVPICTAGFLCDTKFGFGAVYADEIDEDDLIASSNIADEAMTLLDASTESRYECHGAMSANRARGDVITDLVNAMAGKAVLIGATWHVLAGAYVAPSVSLDEGDLAGPIGQIQPLTSRRENCNGIRGTCIFPDKGWQPSDFPALANTAFLNEDGGVRVWKDIDLTPFVISQTQAQRLTKIELLRIRNGLTIGNLPCKMTGFREQAGGTIALSIAKYGLVSEVFEITNGTFAVGGDGALTYSMALRLTGAAVYDWTTDDESGIDAVPTTSLGDPLTVGVPGAPSLLETLFESPGTGGVRSKVTMMWSAAADAFVDFYQPEYKRAPDTLWTPLPTTPSLSAEVFDLPAGVWDFRVKAVNTLGVSSNYATASNITLLSTTAQPVPADVTGFSAAQNGGAVAFKWTPVSSPMLKGYDIAYAAAGATDWANFQLLTEATRGTEMTNAGVPPGTWVFAIRARDILDQLSAHFPLAYVVLTSPNPVISQVDGAPDWLGTLSNFVRHYTGVLVPEGTHTCDTYGWEVFDQFVVDAVSSASYTMAATDTGLDAALGVFLTSIVAPGPGEVGTPVVATFEDHWLSAGSDPNTFTSWTVGTITLRYIRGRITLTQGGSPPAVVGYVKSFVVVLNAGVKTEQADALTVAAGGTTVTFPTPYHSIPDVQFTPTSAGATGGSATDITTTNFKAHVFQGTTDGGGTGNWKSSGV